MLLLDLFQVSCYAPVMGIQCQDQEPMRGMDIFTPVWQALSRHPSPRKTRYAWDRIQTVHLVCLKCTSLCFFAQPFHHRLFVTPQHIQLARVARRMNFSPTITLFHFRHVHYLTCTSASRVHGVSCVLRFVTKSCEKRTRKITGTAENSAPTHKIATLYMVYVQDL